jgi:hypothetical protein
MAWSLGALTFPETEQPTAGSDMEFATPQNWSRFNPIGYSGTILTYLGSKAKEHKLRCFCVVATKNSLVAIHNARTAVTFITPWVPGGVSVVMTELSCSKNRAVAGTDRWECEMTLVEQ